jgi:hypothetical protein
MAALTWRNVDAPDFRGSLDAYRQSSQMLNQALGGASDALGKFDNAQNQGANQQVMLEALKYNDPKAYQDALASGSLTAGVDPRRLSTATIQGLGSRSGDLLNQAVTGQRLQSAQYGQNRTEQLNSATDNAREAIGAMTAAAASGDPAQVAAARQQYGPILAQLQGDQQIGLAKDAQSLQSGFLGNQSKAFNNMTTQRDDAETRAAQAAFTDVLRRSASPDDARSILESQNYDPAVRAKLNNMIQAQFPGTYGSLSSGSGGGIAPSAPGTHGTKAGSAYDATVGFQATPTPISGMTMGQAVDFGEKSLIPATRGRADLGLPPDLGSSAMGPFQITASTMKDLGPKVFGDKWKDTPMTPENQDKLGKELFDQRKGGDLSKTWTSLPDAAPGAYKNKSWDEMRNIIAQGEVGATLDPIPKGATERAVAETTSRFMQNTGMGGAAADIAKNVGDTRPQGQIVNDLTKEGGSFAGADKGLVTEAINRVMQDGQVNAAQAGAILERNPERATWASAIRGYLGGRDTTRNLGGDIRINDAGVQAEIQSQRQGNTVDKMLAQATTGAQVQALQSAQQTFTAAQNQYNAAAARAETQPGLRAQLPRYKAAMDEAQKALELQLESQRTEPNFQARRIARPPTPAEQAKVAAADPQALANAFPRYIPDQLLQD